MNNSKVRVRIAPSPTGYVHVGNLRTILYNYLFAKHNDGTFIVRIEDTDQNRFVPGAMEDLLKTLQWAGFDYQEGPVLLDNGKIKQIGEFGPYIQSERLDIYAKQIKVLLDKKKAYKCFCSKEKLEALREEQKNNNQPPKYDRCCRNLTDEEVAEKIKRGEKYVIRFKMPDDKEVIFDDVIRGVIKNNSDDLDDFVLIKADGYPTYHFANIVDDHFMKITHVLRGDEWIPSTPKHILLYEAFGWTAPLFAHLPPLLGKNKKKLSKRDGDVSVKDFISAGYLKDALINFIALLGWNSGSEQEIYSIAELIKQFSLDSVHKSGAVFDLDKLDWINGIYIRQLTEDQLFETVKPYLLESKMLKEKNNKYYIDNDKEEVSASWLKKALALEQERIKKLIDFPASLKFLFSTDNKYDPQILIWKKSDQSTTVKILEEVAEILASVEDKDFIKENLEKKIFSYINDKAYGNGDVLWPLRVALSGSEKSPGPLDIAVVLGKEKSLNRINSAIQKLHEI